MPLARAFITAAGLTALCMLPHPVPAQLLRGRVIDSQTRQPLLGVSLRLMKDEKVVATAVSDSAGRFIVAAPDQGRYRLAGTRIGYADALTAHVELTADDEVSAELQMSGQAVKVAPLIVEAKRDPYLDMRGFYERLQSRSGDYLSPDQIRRRNAPTVADLLRGLRGIKIQRVNYNNEVYFTGANCHPMIVVDGMTMRWGGKSLGVTQRLDDLVQVHHIDAIEAYRGGSGAPTEYVGPNAGCGVILIWTRHK